MHRPFSLFTVQPAVHQRI